jgi:hypothetical protein
VDHEVLDVLAFSQSSSVNTHGWKLDSGATQHITNTSHGFTSYKSYDVPKILQVGKAEVYLRALGAGTISLHLPSKPDACPCGGSGALTLTQVWYCPDCPFKLISTRRVVQAGYSIKLTQDGATILTSADQAVLWMPMDVTGLYTCLPLEAAIPGESADLVGAVTQVPPVTSGTLSQGMSTSMHLLLLS